MPSMTLQAELLARFGGGGAEGILYVPDLTAWHKWHKERGTLPAEWSNCSLAEVARAMGVPAWVVARPWRVEKPGVEIVTEERDGERTIRYITASGALLERWAHGPDGDWWQTEYPVKTADDLAVARTLVAERTYVADSSSLAELREAVGEGGVVALEIPMRPYSDVLHTLLGWDAGLGLLKGEGKAAIAEWLAILDGKLQDLVAQVALLPGSVVLAPDNLDGQYISPRVFREQWAASYRLTAEIVHRHGKRLVVHAGGAVRRLLPLLAEAGVDGIEGVAPPPQSDATLAEARAAAGPELTLWGGIAQDMLLNVHGQEEFEEAARQAAHAAIGDGRMILGVADRVPVDADLGRLRAILGLVRDAAG